MRLTRRSHSVVSSSTRRVLFIAATASLAASVRAQDRRAMTFEDIARLRALSDVRLSPDGKSVSYTLQ